jgi:predicted ATPase/class 3 adenylate cyclase
VTVPRPSGTVTFLFTDIEGSTRRWETDPEAMRLALAVHDEVLRSAVGAREGWLFKHTGDGVCAAFGSARAAIDAAVAAQHRLGLPVRMGVATGEAERRGDDYFGPVLNRAARVMAAGHGGQILVAASTAALVDGAELVDLGAHRLRDLSGATQLFQVRAAGLQSDFPPLRTVDAVPGNLLVQTTSFVGRDEEVKTVCELVRAHRLVTLTGVGGVGKTRLALQVAAELTGEFTDGVWLVELAPVGDPAAVPDAVAGVLGVIPRAGLTVTGSIAQALAGRRMLVLLDNCEHLLDGTGDLVEQLLAHTTTVQVLATSREGLRVGAEHLWPVPSLDLTDGAGSAAVQLFVDRAQAAKPDFSLHYGPDWAPVVEICRRLDGIALAIELAAARMVSMSASEVLERLADRFRLLSGSRRGLERHQTLRQAVQWSYDLLDDDERQLLAHCSVFAGGFDLAAATHVCDRVDDYAVLDVLDSLVRKSLVNVEHVDGHSRYGMLETIRQFAEEQPPATGTSVEVRDRHARYFAAQAAAHWELWEGPGYRVAADWVDAELDNLRAGFRWAADHDDLVTATAIAAHAVTPAWLLQLFEPIGWAEELVPAATAADVSQLPRLYIAACLCGYVGRLDAAVAYADAAVALETDRRYDPFDPGWSRNVVASVHLVADGDLERYVRVLAELAAQSSFAHVLGLVFLLYMLPAAGRAEEARAIESKTMTVARTHGNPAWIAFALTGTGRAFAETDPARAIDAFRQALVLTREQRIPFLVARVAQESAALEITHGDRDTGLGLLDGAIDSYHRAGNHVDLAATLADLAVFLDRDGQPETAATVYGTSTHYMPTTAWIMNVPAAVSHLRAALGDNVFDEYVAAGAAMEPAGAVRYAREQIRLARFRSDVRS